MLKWLTGPSLEDSIFNLKFTSKQFARDAAKSEKQAQANKLKCKKAMEQGNMDGAKIYAESAIRDQNQYVNYLRLSSRLDSVAGRLESVNRMKSLTKDMQGIVKSMGSVLKSMDIKEITKVMDKFEEQFTNLDISSNTMEQAMASSTQSLLPESQVDALMQQVADEHSLQITLQQVPSRQIQQKNKQEEQHKQVDPQQEALQQRLNNLQ